MQWNWSNENPNSALKFKHYWFLENDKEIKRLLEDKYCLHKVHQDDTSSTSRRRPTTIFVRQSRTGSGTCKTPG